MAKQVNKPIKKVDTFKKDSAEFVKAAKTVDYNNKVFPRSATKTIEGKMFKNIGSSVPARKKAGLETMKSLTKMNNILNKYGNRKSFVDSVTVVKKKKM